MYKSRECKMMFTKTNFRMAAWGSKKKKIEADEVKDDRSKIARAQRSKEEADTLARARRRWRNSVTAVSSPLLEDISALLFALKKESLQSNLNSWIFSGENV